MNRLIVVLMAAGLYLAGPVALGAETGPSGAASVKALSLDSSTVVAQRRVVCLRYRWLYRCVRYQKRCTYRQRGVCLRWTRYCVAQRPYRKVCAKYGYR